MKTRGFPIVLSAPSGAGKSTICRELLRRHAALRGSVSWTTRAPRPGERNGSHYRFVSAREFREAMGRGEFIEWARVHGASYGTPRPSLEKMLAKGLSVVLVIDTQGAAAVRRLYPEALTIFIGAPSWTELVRRLRARGISRSDLELRLKNARREMREISKFDHGVINDDLNHAVDRIWELIRSHRIKRRTKDTGHRT